LLTTMVNELVIGCQYGHNVVLTNCVQGVSDTLSVVFHAP
jgi:hypothetical protein